MGGEIMPIFLIPLILGGVGFAGWGVSKTADEMTDLIKWASVAGVAYFGIKHGGAILKLIKGRK